MKILVTGGAGYIASHTNLELLNAGYEVVAIDNLSNSCKESIRRVEKITGKEISFYENDIRDKEALINIFNKENIDGVIHFAGLKAVGESCRIPLEYYNNNISGTINLLEVMDRFDVKTWCFLHQQQYMGILRLYQLLKIFLCPLLILMEEQS